MVRKVQVTPGGMTRSAAGFTAALGVLFLVFGIIFFSAVMSETPSSEDGLQVLQLAFMVIWIAACIAIIVFNLRVFARPRNAESAALFQLEGVADAEAGAGPDAAFDVRLRKLESLRRDGLISEGEYRQKRAEILEEKW